MPAPKITPTMLGKMRIMRAQGMKYKAIADEFELSLSAPWFALNGMPKRARATEPKLTLRQVYAIRRAYDLGQGTHKQRAAKYGISERYAIKIAYRTRWADLPERGD